MASNRKDGFMKMGKRLLALLMAIVLCGSMIPTAFAAEGAVTLTTKLSASELTTSDKEQTITVTISSDAAFDCDGIGASVIVPTGFTLTKIENSDVTFTATDCSAETGKIAYTSADSENDAIKNICVLTYTVPANVAVGNYTLGLTSDTVEITKDYGDYLWKVEGSVTATLTIKAATVPATGVSLNKGSLSLTAGVSETLIATVNPLEATDKAVTWTSDNKSVATVDQNGKVTAVAAGKATITATTSNGKTATCSVTVGCAHSSKTTYEATDSTCTVAGHDAYSKCDSCDQLFDASNNPTDAIPTKPLAGHSYIEKADAKYLATAGNCANKAVYYKSCSVCGAKGTDTFEGAKNPNDHTHLTSHAAKDATCTTPGNIFYYSCDDCGKLFASDKTTEIASVADTVISAEGHSLTKTEAKAATCEATGNIDYWTCGSCHKLFKDEAGTQEIEAGKEITVKLPHNMTHHAAVPATCTVEGTVEYWSCSICKKNYSDENGTNVLTSTVDPAKGHQMTKTEAKAATCTEDGYEAYWTCSACGKKFSDAEGKNEIDATVPVTKLGHDMTHHELVEATCQKTGMNEYYECSRCKGLFRDSEGGVSVAAEALVIPLAAHTPSTGYAYTGTEHWKSCTVCGEKLDKAPHNFGTVEETATVKECICGYKEFATEPGEDHTCTTPNGWSFDDESHWHACEGCNKKNDEAAHDIDWVIDVEATTTNTGLRHGKCKTCDYVKQEVIAKPSTTPDRPNHRPSGGSATSSDKVQSSKTFDAGIAAYVGLSVLSLTGSALVIGKKKEF